MGFDKEVPESPYERVVVIALQRAGMAFLARLRGFASSPMGQPKAAVRYCPRMTAGGTDCSVVRACTGWS